MTDNGNIKARRLGEPFEFRWVDQEPTGTTWQALSERRGCLWGGVFALAIAWIGALIDGLGGAIIAMMFFGVLGLVLGPLVNLRRRTDDAPVPRSVRREAYIEYTANAFYFNLEVDGKVAIWQPWERIGRFEKVDYWGMFGSSAVSPVKVPWHAIVATSPTGRPWLISSTIESEAEVRARFIALDQRFGVDARASFMLVYEAQRLRTERGGKQDLDETNPQERGDIPREL